MSLQRWVDAIGYWSVGVAAVESIVRIPQRAEPPSVFAEAAWEDLPHDLSSKTFAITGT